MSGNHRSRPARAISIVGLGKLGSPMVACFADRGYDVIGVDVNPATVRAINEGRAPVYEPGLQELLDANRSRIRATEDMDDAVQNSDMTFIIVPTPSLENGSFSLQYALSACEAIGRALRQKPGGHLVNLTSTVMPGATDQDIRPALEAASGKTCGEDFLLCYSPEFIALGSVIHDLLHPDFILVGEATPRAGDLLAAFYPTICLNTPAIARMNAVNAELTKLAVNTYVTTKITFANVLARVCERLPGADVNAVTAGLGMDSRIGPKYLKGAISYGGPCFPRDNLALLHLIRELGGPSGLVEATHGTNRLQIDHLAGLVKSKLPEAGGVVGILGLSYKSNTDVVEEAPGLLLARALLSEEISTLLYDPAAMGNARRALGERARFAESAEDCIARADVVVITTPWPQFRSLAPKLFERPGHPRAIIDCWRILDARGCQAVADYVALGVGEPARVKATH